MISLLLKFLGPLLSLINTIIGYYRAKKLAAEELELARKHSDEAMQLEAAIETIRAANEQKENEERLRDSLEEDVKALRKLGEDANK
jgi:uncharacterized membrane protein YccC